MLSDVGLLSICNKELSREVSLGTAVLSSFVFDTAQDYPAPGWASRGPSHQPHRLRLRAGPGGCLFPEFSQQDKASTERIKGQGSSNYGGTGCDASGDR